MRLIEMFSFSTCSDLGSLDYVEGDFPAPNSRPAAIPASSEFGDDTSNLFQHHFGGIFNGDIFNPFNSFGGIGFGTFNNGFSNFKPWYKG